jgi:hypothetical protein
MLAPNPITRPQHEDQTITPIGIPPFQSPGASAKLGLVSYHITRLPGYRERDRAGNLLTLTGRPGHGRLELERNPGSRRLEKPLFWAASRIHRWPRRVRNAAVHRESVLVEPVYQDRLLFIYHCRNLGVRQPSPCVIPALADAALLHTSWTKKGPLHHSGERTHTTMSHPRACRLPWSLLQCYGRRWEPHLHRRH